MLLFCFGCASPDPNPPRAKPNTGYLDFYADPACDLSWHVESFDARKGQFRVVHSDVKYLEDEVLRLPFVPGSHRFRVSFLNCVVQPAECEVTVQDGRITPVRVAITKSGSNQVQIRDQRRGSTYYGRYGRRTKFKFSETRSVTIALTPEESEPYKPKPSAPSAPK